MGKMSFENHIAIVTGGSRGIGRAIVEDLSEKGSKVYFTYNKNDEAAQIVARETGSIALKCTQEDREKIRQTVDDIQKKEGKIDILVNNAGVTSDQFMMMMPDDDWDRVLNTNVTGTFIWTKAVSRVMLLKKAGVIINVSSISGMVGTGGQSNYCASKGAILAFTRSAAAEFAGKGIRVNAVVPGFIDTDMTTLLPRQIKRSSKERIALKRFGTPCEVAKVVSFLASIDASYILGQSIVVDGGLTTTIPARMN